MARDESGFSARSKETFEVVEDRQWAKPRRPPPREYRRNRADFGDSDDAD
jgi:hypothetical protein